LISTSAKTGSPGASADAVCPPAIGPAAGNELSPSGAPATPWLNFGIALAVFASSFLYLLLFRRYTSIEPDEGIILQGAQRIMHGQVLYRDFFSYLTPGSYYLLALVFRIFGSSMLVARTALAVSGALLSVFTYLMARRACPIRIALIAAYFVTITCLPWRFLVLHNWDSTLWACAAIYCAVRWMEITTKTQRLRDTEDTEVTGCRPQITGTGSSLVTHHSSLCFWPLATGSFVSLTALFEQSKGAGLALGLAAGFVILVLARRGQEAEGRELTTPDCRLPIASQSKIVNRKSANLPLVARHSSLVTWPLAIGLAWPFLLTFAYFGAQHALPQMVADWLWPLRHYSHANAVPYGWQNWSDEARHSMFSGCFVRVILSALLIAPCFILPVLPLIGVGILLYLLSPWGRKLALERWQYYIMICAAISGLLVSVVTARADILHFVYLGPFLCLIIAWFAGLKDFDLGLPRPLNVLVGWFVVFCFTLLGLAFLLDAHGARVQLSTRRGLVMTSSRDQVIPYVQAHLAAGSNFFIYPYLPLYYYLTATYSPTRFDYLQPGMHTQEQDNEALRELQTDRTRAVLFEFGFNQKIASSWPNTPIQSIANDPVSDYILAQYRPCRVLKSAEGSPFLFMVRNGFPCPK
jgi:hypothetical protein